MSSNLVFRKLNFKIISGNIGIGTNNPQTILHLYSSNNSKFLLENALDGESEITFKNSNNLWKIGLNCNLNIGSYYNEPISAITITSNLNIGIGVSYPREKLEIAGHIIPAACNLYDLGNSNLRFRDLYLSGNTIDLGGTKISREQESGALNVLTATGVPTDINAKAIYISESFHIVSNLYTITREGNIGIGLTNPQAYLHIIEHSNIHPLRIDDPKTNTTPFIIKHDGNVGIGTTNPQAYLHVQGAIHSISTNITESVNPPGTIIYVATTTVPTGYIKANGATISRSVYAALFSAIGTTFGVGNGSTTFTIPDLRGEFIRGWDDSRGVDSGRAFGNAQTDAFQNITGSMNTNHSLHLFGSGTATGAYALTGALGGSLGSGGTAAYYRSWNFDASRVARTSTETRPRNISLLACIKY